MGNRKTLSGWERELFDHRLISDTLTNWDVIIFGFVTCFWLYATNDVHLTSNFVGTGVCVGMGVGGEFLLSRF